MDNGRLQLNIGPDISCAPDDAPDIADGNWHHVAVVLTGRHVNTCGDILFYIDGNEFSPGSLVDCACRLFTRSALWSHPDWWLS